MSGQSYYEQERKCAIAYAAIDDTCFHLCTPESYAVLFTSENDYIGCMNIIGLSSSVYKDIRIFTFQVMSNHLHLVVSGREERILLYFETIRRLLRAMLKSKGIETTLSGFKPQLHRIKDLENLRNVIAYVNRNGFVVHPEFTPFSYPWGANGYFFNPEAKHRYRDNASPSQLCFRRTAGRSRMFDKSEGVLVLDNVVSPMCFCDIETAESMFRDARHYFFCISKNVESNAEIASLIGESVYYSDEDMFSILSSYIKKNYGINNPSQLPPDGKIIVARMMHNKYHASRKQIQRMLKLNDSVIGAMNL